MAMIQHVYKRGSVYWWRRRLPNGTGSHALVRMEISLSTKSVQQARLIAAEVTMVSERLLPGMRGKMIDPLDARKILVAVATQHTAKLDAIAASELAFGEDVESSREQDLVSGWAYRLFSAQGTNARIGEAEEREMRAAGLDAATIGQVSAVMDYYRSHGVIPPNRGKIEAIMATHGIPVTRVNFQQAENLYLRGMSAALLNTGRRWSGIRPDDVTLLQAALAEIADGPLAAPLDQVSAQTAGSSAVSPCDLPLQSGAPLSNSPIQPGHADKIELDEAAFDTENRSLVELVERAAAERVASEEWDIKTSRQHIALAKLFVKFVRSDNPREVRQSHIADFKSIFYKMPKNYGKSPRDFSADIQDILKRAENLPPEQRGFSISTINRHMTQMGNIAAICKHAGYPFAAYEGVSGLRNRRRGDARDERGRFTTEEVSEIFKLPIWMGSESEENRFAPGNLIVHDAAYWVPIIAIYLGARREEICGLCLDEVELDAGKGLPCLRIAKSQTRRIKTPQSKRRVPLHPELIRLGFAEYVEALRRLDHTHLFPELLAAAASTPLGDVFDDDWQEMRDRALPEAKSQNKVFHSLRHWCNDEMKQLGVSAELRKDILGHKNSDINEGRYTSPARLQVMAEALDKLPIPTSHLVAQPIHICSGVIEHRKPVERKKRQS